MFLLEFFPPNKGLQIIIALHGQLFVLFPLFILVKVMALCYLYVITANIFNEAVKILCIKINEKTLTSLRLIKSRQIELMVRDINQKLALFGLAVYHKYNRFTSMGCSEKTEGISVSPLLVELSAPYPSVSFFPPGHGLARVGDVAIGGQSRTLPPANPAQRTGRAPPHPAPSLYLIRSRCQLSSRSHRSYN